MAIALKQRRVFAVSLESPRGTFLTGINPLNDAIPMIRELTVTPTPVSIERPTIRLTLTPLGSIYPGVSTIEMKVTAELGGLPANPKASYDVPVWFDLFRACGFRERSSLTADQPRLLQNVTSLASGAAGTPLRHGETVTGNGGTIAGTGIVIGDFFAEDDVLCVRETIAPTGTALTTWTGATSTRVATGTRSANIVAALELQSDVNLTDTVSLEAYLDGKRWRAKGCMGNVEIQMEYGSTLLGAFTMQGIVNAYADQAMPSTPNEVHKIAPFFLGKEVRFYEIGATPKGYGRDAGTFANVATTPTVNGSLTKISVNTGNTVVLHKNALDPTGINFALITARAPTGSFDPDEVASTDFDWITKFTNGTPLRFKAMVGSAGTVTTQDGNTLDLICPGAVLNQMGDAERDGINSWDAGFKITGSNYSTTAGQETPGNDNEFTLIYR